MSSVEGIRSRRPWEPFGLANDDLPPIPASGYQVINLAMRRTRGEDANRPKDRAVIWLRNAMIALGLLAAAAAAVSYSAQYRMVYAVKGIRLVAGLEAGIPDMSAVVFASLGIALALHGRRAVRARILNVASVATSIGMNALAAGPGWRDAAIWVMPPVAYALASDTAIGVIRAYVLARQRQLGEGLAEDEVTPLAIVGGLFLWWLRLVLAPASTLSGFRAWVVQTCPVAPGRRALPAVPSVAALPAALDTPGSAALQKAARSGQAAGPAGRSHRGPRAESKTARFLALVQERHGELAGIEPAAVSRICTALAPEAGLDTGAARSALRPLVLAARAEAQS
jgi:hypothetical protein